MLNRTILSFLRNRVPSDTLLLIMDKSDLFYLTNCSIDGYTLGITKDKIFFLTTKMIATQLTQYFPLANIVVGENLIEQLSLLPKKFHKISLNKTVSYAVYQLLKKKYRIIFDSILTNLRQKKTKKEIENITIATKIVHKILKKVVKTLSRGITELEVKNYILKLFIDYNVEPAFEPIVAFDENTSYPHHISGNKQFSENSLVLIDLGCKFNGYCCDITRMYGVKKNTEVYSLYQHLCRLQNILISMCRPGTKVAQIDFFAKKYFKSLGIEKNLLHSVGHGLGIDVHEAPSININNKTVLEKGMVITIEPGIYFQNKFGLRVEDDILITSSQPKIISRKIK